MSISDAARNHGAPIALRKRGESISETSDCIDGVRDSNVHDFANWLAIEIQRVSRWAICHRERGRGTKLGFLNRGTDHMHRGERVELRGRDAIDLPAERRGVVVFGHVLDEARPARMPTTAPRAAFNF